jgi:hypothetical protein
MMMLNKFLSLIYAFLYGIYGVFKKLMLLNKEGRQHLMLGKLGWLLLMPLLLTPPYVLSNRIHYFTPHEITSSALDNAIPFTPELTWLYFVLFPLMWWAVMRQRTVVDAKRFVYGGAAIAWIVSIIFWVYPTTFHRSNIDYDGLYSWLMLIDTHYNACPSLHGTFAVYSGAWIVYATKKISSLILSFIVVAMIFYATIAIRQHGIVDLVLGGIIGFIAFRFSRNFFRNAASCKV